MYIKNPRTVFILILTFAAFFPAKAEAQQSRLSKGVNGISDYIASDSFIRLADTVPPLSLVDSIYVFALRLNNYNISETLLSLTFGAVPYNKVPLKVPLIGAVLNYPLISACDSIYRKKNANLPSRLFEDTPNDSFGDRDKIAHFFGSAFLSYSQTIFDLTDLIGYFVEYFEEAFKVQSGVDMRDVKADELGKIFGKALKNDKNILPSAILRNKTLMTK